MQNLLFRNIISMDIIFVARIIILVGTGSSLCFRRTISRSSLGSSRPSIVIMSHIIRMMTHILLSLIKTGKMLYFLPFLLFFLEIKKMFVVNAPGSSNKKKINYCSVVQCSTSVVVYCSNRIFGVSGFLNNKYSGVRCLWFFRYFSRKKSLTRKCRGYSYDSLGL